MKMTPKALYYLLVVAGVAFCWLKFSTIGQLVEGRLYHYQKYNREDEGYGYVARDVPPEEQVEGKYAFAASGRKTMSAAYVSGTNCDDLRGSFYTGPRGEGVTWGAAKGPSEKETRLKWAEQERTGKSGNTGKFYCITPVKNIGKYLAQGGQLSWDTGNTIILKDGPVLLFLGDTVMHNSKPDAHAVAGQNGLPENAVLFADKSAVLGKIEECDDKSGDYCIPISFYSYDAKIKEYTINAYYTSPPGGLYRIFCWDCDAFKNSGKTLTRRPAVELNIYGAYLLDGGLMVNDMVWKVVQHGVEGNKEQRVVQEPFEIGFLPKIRELIELSKRN